MNIQFPQNVTTKYFYALTLRKLCQFLYASDFSSELYIDLRQTDYIEPSVLCDLINYLYLLHDNKDIDTYLLFGENKRLISFMDRCKFLTLSHFEKKFKTDIITLPSEDDSDSIRRKMYGKTATKAENTEHIRAVLLPHYYDDTLHEYQYGEAYDTPIRRKMLTDEATNKIQSQIQRDLSTLILLKETVMKETQFKENLINIIGSLSPAYCEIVDNSIRHGSDCSEANKYCFYTFHFYGRSGLCFGSSDVGDGFYESFRRKFFERRIKPVIFTYEEYMDPSNSSQMQSLMGILEGIAYRLDKKLEYGLPYILSTIVLELHGQLTVHSDCTALVLTREVIEDLFVIEENELYGTLSKTGDPQYNQYKLSTYQRDYMRRLAMDIKMQNDYVKAGTLHLYDYRFPGTHVSATVEVKEPAEV